MQLFKNDLACEFLKNRNRALYFLISLIVPIPQLLKLALLNFKPDNSLLWGLRGEWCEPPCRAPSLAGAPIKGLIHPALWDPWGLNASPVPGGQCLPPPALVALVKGTWCPLPN